MKFIRDLIARKSGASKPATPKPEIVEMELGKPASPLSNLKAAAQDDVSNPAIAEVQAAETGAMNSSEILARINAKTAPDADKAADNAGSVNIWDMDDAAEAASPAAEPPAPEPEVARKSRRRRNQTRVLGFNPASDVVSIFDKAETKTAAGRMKFPVGWVLVTDGPGRGECFALSAGMSQIGRGEDQAVQLDFGDNSISRSNHAAIVYDSETHKFMLGHGGKQNIVRLNNTPVISNEELSSEDEIKIGETTLRFIALCGEKFNWGETPDGEESEDVAIA